MFKTFYLMKTRAEIIAEIATNYVERNINDVARLAKARENINDYEMLFAFDLTTQALLGEDWLLNFNQYQEHLVAEQQQYFEKFAHAKVDILFSEVENCDTVYDWKNKLHSNILLEQLIQGTLLEEYTDLIAERNDEIIEYNYIETDRVKVLRQGIDV